jgi:hypothetical protein
MLAKEAPVEIWMVENGMTFPCLGARECENSRGSVELFALS